MKIIANSKEVQLYTCILQIQKEKQVNTTDSNNKPSFKIEKFSQEKK